MNLRVISQTNSTVTLGWDPPPGVEWYTFWADDSRVSNGPAMLKDGTERATVRFSKGARYRVEALGVIAADTYP